MTTTIFMDFQPLAISGRQYFGKMVTQSASCLGDGAHKKYQEVSI